jgi:hypothetical protein
VPEGEGQREEESAFEAISVPERIGAVILIATTLFIGIYPRCLLDLIVPALNSPLMLNLLKGQDR